jgi:uncharacterized membrane protein (UPF0127 family)
VKNANPVSRKLLAVFWAVLVCGVFLPACRRQDREKEAIAKPLSELFPIKVGSQVVRMQLAISEQEKNLGLMGRRDLAPDQGMLFLFERPDRMRFYMRNTPTPLDIGYFSKDGTLREIYQMYPFDETPVSSKSYDIQFALEMNQGWFKQNGVKPGGTIDLKALLAAAKARGVDPQEIGMGSGQK